MIRRSIGYHSGLWTVLKSIPWTEPVVVSVALAAFLDFEVCKTTRQSFNFNWGHRRRNSSSLFLAGFLMDCPLLSTLQSRQTIANLGQEFVCDNSTILTHGFSRVVLALLKLAVQNGKRFSVICTGTTPHTGLSCANSLGFLLAHPTFCSYLQHPGILCLIAGELLFTGGLLCSSPLYFSHQINGCQALPLELYPSFCFR